MFIKKSGFLDSRLGAPFNEQDRNHFEFQNQWSNPLGIRFQVHVLKWLVAEVGVRRTTWISRCTFRDKVHIDAKAIIPLRNKKNILLFFFQWRNTIKKLLIIFSCILSNWASLNIDNFLWFSTKRFWDSLILFAEHV